MPTSKKNTPKPFVIDDRTPPDPIFAPVVDGESKGHGLVPRKHSIHPPEMFSPPSEIKLIPTSEVPDRVKERKAKRAGLLHLRNNYFGAGKHVPALDQNGHGYCWAYSTGGCVMLDRMKSNEPYRRLNPHSVAAVIKNGRDEGGWCGLSAKFLREVGIASEEHWPKHSRDLRNYDDDCKAEMKLHRVTEDWVDLTRNVYDQNLTFEQVVTCLLNDVPCAVDFNWWSHSVCAIDVDVLDGEIVLIILNSWTDGWGTLGTGVLRGSRKVPDGALAVRVTGAAG